MKNIVQLTFTTMELPRTEIRVRKLEFFFLLWLVTDLVPKNGFLGTQNQSLNRFETSWARLYLIFAKCLMRFKIFAVPPAHSLRKIIKYFSKKKPCLKTCLLKSFLHGTSKKPRLLSGIIVPDPSLPSYDGPCRRHSHPQLCTGRELEIFFWGVGY